MGVGKLLGVALFSLVLLFFIGTANAMTNITDYTILTPSINLTSGNATFIWNQGLFWDASTFIMSPLSGLIRMIGNFNVSGWGDFTNLYINGTPINTTISAYADAMDAIFNTSMKGYADSQDSAYNTSMKTYCDSQDTAFNTSMKTYVDSVDSSTNTSMEYYVNQSNSSMKTYCDSIDASTNTSMEYYVNQTNASMQTYSDLNDTLSNTTISAYARAYADSLANLWVDNGTELSPNTDYAINVNISDGWVDADAVYEAGALLNDTVATYTRAVAALFNTSMKGYADSQDTAFNTSMKTYCDSQDTAFNTSMKTYADSQDSAYNTSIADYVDDSARNLSHNYFIGNVSQVDFDKVCWGTSCDCCKYFNGTFLIEECPCTV